MISEAERNYQTKSWSKVENFPEDARALSPIELMYFCNTDSQAFRDLVTRQRADKAFLLDYELIALGYDTMHGSMIHKTRDGRIIFTIFTPDGSVTYLQEL